MLETQQLSSGLNDIIQETEAWGIARSAFVTSLLVSRRRTGWRCRGRRWSRHCPVGSLCLSLVKECRAIWRDLRVVSAQTHPGLLTLQARAVFLHIRTTSNP